MGLSAVCRIAACVFVSFFIIFMVSFTNWNKQRYMPGQISQHTTTFSSNGQPNKVDWLKVFKFVPNMLRDCTELFPKKDIFPESLNMKYSVFEDYIKKNVKVEEGHSGPRIEQKMVFYELVKAPHVRTVCETGFNVGHSSFMWLESNQYVKVYSFDIGQHKYALGMAAYLQNEYPGRLVVTWGDSSKTLPQFQKTHPNVSCDLVFIDGGHSTKICLADFYNFKKISHKDTIVIVDNYPETHWNFKITIGNCWEKVKRLGEIMEIFNCYSITKMREMGFSVARYLF